LEGWLNGGVSVMAAPLTAPTIETISLQARIENLEKALDDARDFIGRQFAEDRARLAKLEAIPRPKRTTLEVRADRIKKIDQLLISHNNIPISFADMGKLLGYPKETRRQNMTNLVNRLFKQFPEHYEVRNSKLGGKTVRLVPEYLNHLLRGGV
jgi:hypothetical protein